MKNYDAVDIRIDKAKNGSVEYGIRHSVNVAPVLESTHNRRRMETELRRNKKNEYRHFADLDMVTCMNIREKYGIDPMNLREGEGKLLFQIVERDYPLLKTTNMRVNRRIGV